MKTLFLTIIGRLSTSDWLVAMDIGLMIAILCSTLLRKRISSRIQIESAGLLAGYLYVNFSKDMGTWYLYKSITNISFLTKPLTSFTTGN